MSRLEGKRYVFVLPRFGEGIAGGAETLAGELARKLSENGAYVEVWTTCAKDNRTWSNEFKSGEDTAFGLKVLRFPVSPRNLDAWVPLQIGISQGLSLSLEDELEWMKESVSSNELYLHIAQKAEEFDRIFFAPYLFGTTFWGSLIKPEKSCLIPCLHDEHYAYTQIMQSMFNQVKACLFNALPEQDLAQRLYGQLYGGEVGMGFELLTEDEVLNLKPYFKEAFPYIIYVGRKETGKNAHTMLDYFVLAKERNLIPSDIKIVIVGGGSFDDLERPQYRTREDVLDLAHVSEEDKRRLIKYSQLLCQPSVNESFSIVLMEAWRLEVPVLVHSNCPVTRSHVVASGGGLYFSDQIDFAGAVRESINNQNLRNQMGVSGKLYVAQKYSWEAVIERFIVAMENIENSELQSIDRSLKTTVND